MIYGALGIPVFVAIILYLGFKHKTLWWEFLIPLGVSVALVFSFKFFAEKSQTTDIEFWGETLVRTEYYEDWNEYIHQTCTCCCDEDGTNCTTYDCSYVRYHPPKWFVVGSLGSKIKVNKKTFKRLVAKFSNESFVDLRRNYHTNDGDKYISNWPNTKETVECVTTKHIYENRVQASRSIFNFPEITEEEKKKNGIYEYPKIHNYYKQNSILGDVPNKKLLEKKMEFLNSKLGPKKQVKAFIIIFKNKARSIGSMQEAYWKGGNKNEFIVTIGVDDNFNVQWCYPFSWTESVITKINSRDFVEEQEKLDLTKTIDFLYKELEANFIRKKFKDFSYLKVEPTLKQVLITYIVTLLVNLGLSIWIIKNNAREYSSW